MFAQGNRHTLTHDDSNVLVAAVNLDPSPAKGGPDVLINDNALVGFSSAEGTFEANRNAGEQIVRYVVRAGDNLSLIAKMFGVSVNTIRWANDLSRGETIKIDQELLILPIDGVRYTVKKNDNIKSIAKKFQADVDEILNFNNLALADNLDIGQEIIIPGGEVIVTTPSPSASVKTKSVRDSGPEIPGYYIRPVLGVRTQGLHGHNGIDIGNRIGTPIVAAATGEVVIARSSGWNGSYGQMVVITHPNGTQTLYAHMSKVEVVSGEKVVKGQKIGEVGNTGNSTGPHLHFEIRGAKNPF